MDAPCLDCGEPFQIEMRDGKVLSAKPEGIFGYVVVPFAKWKENTAYA